MNSLKIDKPPPYILLIESTTTMCSVALAHGQKLIAVREIDDGFNHAALLTQFVASVLKEAGLEASQLHAIAVSKGPGSYTGLRIGISVAKGICFAASIPLIGISAVDALALALVPWARDHDVLIPMIDAGRMEVYCAAFDRNLEPLWPLNARIIHKDSFVDLPNRGKILLAGNGASKLKETFAENPRVEFHADLLPSAQWLLNPAINAWNNSHFENLAWFAPLYFKDFVAGKPKVKGLF